MMRPEGRKKLVPKWRSSSSITAAAVSGGNASSPRIDAMKYDHTVSGRRIMDSPGARTLNTVATMFRPLMVNEAMNSAMLRSQIVWPICEPGTAAATALSGGYAVQPDAAAPPSTRNDAEHDDRREERDPVGQHVQERERHVPGADLQRHQVIAETADQHEGDEEEHHDGAVHGDDCEVELGCHDAARHAKWQQARQPQPLVLGPPELKSNQRRERRAGQGHHQAREDVLDPDDLVVGAEDVATKESELAHDHCRADVMGWIVAVRRPPACSSAPSLGRRLHPQPVFELLGRQHVEEAAHAVVGQTA